MKLFQVFGHMHGYPWGVTRTVEAETIEEAHEEGEHMVDEVISVKEISE